MTPIRACTITAVLLLALAGCGSGGDAPTPADVPTPAPTIVSNPAPTASADPYEKYMKLAPKGAPRISREDAQARAYLGCGQTFAPGTVDAALAVAYADLCKRGG